MQNAKAQANPLQDRPYENQYIVFCVWSELPMKDYPGVFLETRHGTRKLCSVRYAFKEGSASSGPWSHNLEMIKKR